MNKTSLIASVAGIALLLASAAPALAEDVNVSSNNSVNVSTHSSVTVNGEEQSESSNVETSETGEHRGLLNGLGKLKLMASSTARTLLKQEREDGKASSTQNRIEKGQEKGDTSIDNRIKSLEELSARLANIKLLPATVLASIQATLSAEIAQLNTLKSQIGADTSTTTLKTDLASITGGNRVYLLVEPKARIASAASRIDAVVIQFQALATKLQDRIVAAQTAGTNVSAAVTAMTDFNAKIADAKVQADAAVAETANLQADNGDATILASNTAALKDARAKLKVAEGDLKAARADAKTIVNVVRVVTSVTATTTP